MQEGQLFQGAGFFVSRAQLTYKEIKNKGQTMDSITIDDKEYDLESLSDEAKEHVASLNYVDDDLRRLALRMAALQTARNTYSLALKELLPAHDDDVEIVPSEDDD